MDALIKIVLEVKRCVRKATELVRLRTVWDENESIPSITPSDGADVQSVGWETGR